MSVLRVPDISEWQGAVDFHALRGATDVVILRAHSGYGPDTTFQANRAAAHAAGMSLVGVYQYLAPDRDPAVQAREFMAVLGTVRGDEWVIVDVEAGAGNQSARVAAWMAVLDAATRDHRKVWSYSGLYFARSHGLHPEWIAAYTPTEPSDAHLLWQATDAATFPGINGNVDCSIYRGTTTDLARTLGVGTAIQADRMPSLPPSPGPHPGGKVWPGTGVAAVGYGGVTLLAVTGTDGHIWLRDVHGVWCNLAGQSRHTPAVCSWGPGRLDVACTGMDGAVWHRAYYGGVWHGWETLGGKVVSGPALASPSPNTLSVTAVSPAGECWWRAWTGTQWTTWA